MGVESQINSTRGGRWRHLLLGLVLVFLGLVALALVQYQFGAENPTPALRVALQDQLRHEQTT